MSMLTLIYFNLRQKGKGKAVAFLLQPSIAIHDNRIVHQIISTKSHGQQFR